MNQELQNHALRHLKSHGVPQSRIFCDAPRHVPSRSHSVHAHTLPERLTDSCDGFLLWVLRQTGLAGEHYRAGPLRRRIPACLRALGAADTAAAQRKIEEQPSLLQTAVDALLLGVTEFFRDPAVFEAVRYMLVQNQRPPLRIWSVSCSVGCELYSMAILLAEHGLALGSYLLGTDCRHDALAHASRAMYSEHYLKHLTPSLRNRYFHPADNGALVRQSIRSRVHWRQHDICAAADAPTPELWDVILWRNTAIYLNPTTAAAVWKRLVQQLRPGGLLITGRAERPCSHLPLHRLATCVHRRVSP